MKAATKAAVLCAAIAAAFSAQAELKDFTVNGETVTKAQQEAQAKDVMAARRTDKMTPEIEAEVKRRLTRITAVAQAAKRRDLIRRRRSKQNSRTPATWCFITVPLQTSSPSTRCRTRR